jgi:hypothetical protein
MIEETTNPLDFDNDVVDAEVIPPDEVALDNIKQTQEHLAKLEREKRNAALGLSPLELEVGRAFNKLSEEEMIHFLAFVYKHIPEAVERAITQAKS